MKILGWLGLALAACLLLAAFLLHTPDRTRAELEALYLRAPADMRVVAGTPLHVRESGPRDGPAIILLHGFGASLHTWEPWARGLDGRMRVIRLDIPGSGLSPPDVSGDYSDERSMQLLGAVMDQLGLSSASLVGNSMGGRIAWRFAARFPARVDRLVLIAPDGFASPGFAYDTSPDVPAILHLMRVALPKAMLKANLVPAYGDASRLDDATVTRYHDLMLAPGARAAMLARMAQVRLVDPALLLPLITAPTLLLWGGKDAMIPVANAQDYLRLLRDARLVVFPDLGHVPHEEAPDQSLRPVEAFLSGSGG